MFAKWIAESSIAFQITSISRDPGTGAVTLTWNSRPGKTYSVQASGDMADFWDEVNDSVASGGATTTYTDSTIDLGTTRRYFQIVEN